MKVDTATKELIIRVDKYTKNTDEILFLENLIEGLKKLIESDLKRLKR